MSIIAEWNGKIFEVSPNRLMAFDSFSAAWRLKKDQNNDSAGQSAANVRALEPLAITISVMIGDAAGLDVRREVEDWSAMVGAAAPFILAGRRFGAVPLRLTEVSLGETVIDDKGRMRKAVLGISLNEDAPEPVKDKPKTGGTVSGGGGNAPGIASGVSSRAASRSTSSSASRSTSSSASRSTSTNTQTASALGIGARVADKALKKPLSQQAKQWNPQAMPWERGF